MPIYEYECHACGEEHEILQQITAGALRKCPSCGALKLHRKVSLSAFHLKGQGWYVTDYAANGKNKEAEKAEKKKEDSAPKGDGEKAGAAAGKGESGGSTAGADSGTGGGEKKADAPKAKAKAAD